MKRAEYSAIKRAAFIECVRLNNEVNQAINRVPKRVVDGDYQQAVIWKAYAEEVLCNDFFRRVPKSLSLSGLRSRAARLRNVLECLA